MNRLEGNWAQVERLLSSIIAINFWTKSTEHMICVIVPLYKKRIINNIHTNTYSPIPLYQCGCVVLVKLTEKKTEAFCLNKSRAVIYWNPLTLYRYTIHIYIYLYWTSTCMWICNPKQFACVDSRAKEQVQLIKSSFVINTYLNFLRNSQSRFKCPLISNFCQIWFPLNPI